MGDAPTAGCVDIDPHTSCMHNRSVRSLGGTVRTHQAIRVNHTEIGCRMDEIVKEIEARPYVEHPDLGLEDWEGSEEGSGENHLEQSEDEEP
jgi:hypothetical protein